MHINHPLGQIHIKSVSNTGLLLDETSPDFGWEDLRGEYFFDTTGANAPTLEFLSAGGVEDLGFNASDVFRIRLHLSHENVAQGNKYLHPHVQLADGAVASGVTNLVISYQIAHSYGSIGTGDLRGANPVNITLTQTITIAQINAIGSGKNQAFDLQIANSGGTGGLLNSSLMLPDDVIRVKGIVTSIPTISGGSSNKIFITPIDMHRQVTKLATKFKDRVTGSGSFYGVT